MIQFSPSHIILLLIAQLKICITTVLCTYSLIFQLNFKYFSSNLKNIGYLLIKLICWFGLSVNTSVNFMWSFLSGLLCGRKHKYYTTFCSKHMFWLFPCTTLVWSELISAVKNHPHISCKVKEVCGNKVPKSL